jgi:hypothetical protein
MTAGSVPANRLHAEVLSSHQAALPQRIQGQRHGVTYKLQLTNLKQGPLALIQKIWMADL